MHAIDDAPRFAPPPDDRDAPDDASALLIERNGSAGADNAISGLATVTAAEFCATELGPIDYLARPIVVRGGMTTIYGTPKVGKTTLAAHLVSALLNPDRPFLDGVRAIGGPALWLDLEQPRRVSQRRFSEAGSSDRLHIYRGAPPSLAQLLATIDALGVSLVIVDSMVRWLMMENENDASEFDRKMGPILTAFQARDVTSIIIDHAGKGEGTGGKNLRGTSDKLAKVDIACEVKAIGALTDNKRRLCFTSREEPTPDIIIRLENGRYVLDGSAPAVAFHEHREKIEKAIRFGHNRKTTMAEYLHVSEKTIEAWIAPLVEQRIVGEEKAPSRGNPITYVLGTSQRFLGSSDEQDCRS